MSSAGVGSRLPFWMIRSEPVLLDDEQPVQVARRADRVVGRRHPGDDRIQSDRNVASRNVGQHVLLRRATSPQNAAKTKVNDTNFHEFFRFTIPTPHYFTG